MSPRVFEAVDSGVRTQCTVIIDADGTRKIQAAARLTRPLPFDGGRRGGSRRGMRLLTNPTREDASASGFFFGRGYGRFGKRNLRDTLPQFGLGIGLLRFDDGGGCTVDHGPSIHVEDGISIYRIKLTDFVSERDACSVCAYQISAQRRHASSPVSLPFLGFLRFRRLSLFVRRFFHCRLGLRFGGNRRRLCWVIDEVFVRVDLRGRSAGLSGCTRGFPLRAVRFGFLSFSLPLVPLFLGLLR